MDEVRITRNDEGAEYAFREGCSIAEWWNVDADPAVSVARARVGSGVTTRWHRLHGITERYVILAGSGRVELGEYAPEAVGAGTVVLIPDGVAQRITNDGNTDLVFLAVCTPRFRLDRYEDVDPL